MIASQNVSKGQSVTKSVSRSVAIRRTVSHCVAFRSVALAVGGERLKVPVTLPSMARDTKTVTAFKAARKLSGELACDACAWRVPVGLFEYGQADAYRVMHAHHVVPVSCGGADAETNLVLLCPNCHALAHRLGSIALPTKLVPLYRWVGPTSVAALLAQLRRLVLDAAGWTEALRAEHEARAEDERRERMALEAPVAAERRECFRLSNGGRA